MATDFTYGGKQILSSGPFKPNGKDIPNDARSRVQTYADIATIPNPYVGLKITVKADETNNNKMTDYIVKSLKANSMGVENSVIDEVVRYVDYLGVNSELSNINSAVNLNSENINELNSQLDTNVQQINEIKNTKANEKDVYKKVDVYTKSEANALISSIPKGDKGEPGTASIAIDDSMISGQKTWTSDRINNIFRN